MISHLRGVVTSTQPGSCVVECGGVGYEVACCVETSSRLRAGQEARLHVHHHLSVDHAGGASECLYGFEAPEDKALFRLLMTVSGVGPRLALLIMSGASRSSVLQALSRKDTAFLRTFKGVGPKMAERLGLELSDKAARLQEPGSPAGGASSRESDAISALVSLGYAEKPSAQAVAKAAHADPKADTASLVKAALKNL